MNNRHVLETLFGVQQKESLDVDKNMEMSMDDAFLADQKFLDFLGKY